MAEWYIRFYDHSPGYDQLVSEYTIFPQGLEIRNSEPGGFTAELPLGQLRRGSAIQGMSRDEFAPWRTDWEIWRSPTGHPAQGILIEGGILTSLNFNKNRDTALIAGKSWLHYLQRRIYPFNPAAYEDADELGWALWPRRWPDTRGMYGPSHFNDTLTVAQLKDLDLLGIDISIIVREIFQSMIYEPPTRATYSIGPPSDNVPTTPQWPTLSAETLGVPRFTHNIPLIGAYGTYEIQPGDSTTIYDHIKKLSEMVEGGFEFEIDPTNLRFRVFPGRRDSQEIPFMSIIPSVNDGDVFGEIEAYDWTNEGPDATYLIGLGTSNSTGSKRGQIWTDIDNVFEFWRTDKVYDFGQLSDSDVLLDMLKDQNDLHPQKKLQVTLLNPEFFTLNWYTSGRPRSLIGARVKSIADFGLHRVDAFFRINAIRWDVDKSTNERVTLELEMVYEP